MRTSFLAASLLFVTGTVYAQNYATPKDAFNAGKDMANQQLPLIKDPMANAKNKGVPGMSSGTDPKDVLGNGYSPSVPAEASHFHDSGLSLVNDGGLARQTECVNLPANATPEKKQECEAVKYLAGYRPSNTPTLDRAHDPLFVGAKQVVSSAKSSTNDINIPCDPTVNTGSAITKEDVCQEMRPAYARKCGEVLNVNVDIQLVERCSQGSAMPIYFSGWGGGVGYWIDAICNNNDPNTVNLQYWWWNGNNSTKNDGGRASFPVLPPGSLPPASDFNAGNANAEFSIDNFGLPTYLACNDDTCTFAQYSCTQVVTGLYFDSLTDTYYTLGGLVLNASDVNKPNKYLIPSPYDPSSDLYDCNVPRQLSCNANRPGAYCSRSFARPGIKEIVVITDTWDDQCSMYRGIQATPPAPFANDKKNTCYDTQSGTWDTCIN